MSRFITVRNRPLSLWQSAVYQTTKPLERSDPQLAKTMRFAAGLHAEATVKGHPVPTPPPPAPGMPLSLEHHIALSKAHFQRVWARKRGDYLTETQAEAVIRDYSNWDPNWLQCEVLYAAWYIDEGKKPIYRDWVVHSEKLAFGIIPYTLPANATVLMLGDWGTGMTDTVAMLTAGVAQFRPDAILHVGDIYYSGTPQECHDHVGTVIRNLRSTYGLSLPFFTIPGNHEYYSGGQGFYDVLDGINAGIPNCHQQASYFCLRSEDGAWQFLAMDTGYDDHDPTDDGLSADTRGPNLHPTELVWHYDKIDNFSGATILLSHHQLYSAFSEINGKPEWGPAYLNQNLYNAFLPKRDKITAWFWGHEHNFAQYPDQLGFQNCRLFGCSAYEMAQGDDPYDYQYKQIKYGPIPPSSTTYQVNLSPHTTGTRHFYNHMFAILTLQPASGGTAPSIAVDYYQYPSWDQDYAGPRPTHAAKLCSETISPPTATHPTKELTFNKILINGNEVTNVAQGIALTSYQGWLVAAWPQTSNLGSNQYGPIYYMFRDIAGWNGNRPLPVVGNEGSAPYACNGLPAISPGPNGSLYCVYMQGNASSPFSSPLYWGATNPNDAHLLWRPPQPVTIQATGATPVPEFPPALAYHESSDTLIAVYPAPPQVDVGAPFVGYTIYYASLKHENGDYVWAGNQPIPSISGIGQPAAGNAMAATMVGDVLFIAYASPLNTSSLCLIWGTRDALGNMSWGGTQAVVSGKAIAPYSSQAGDFCGVSMTAVGGRLVIFYIGASGQTAPLSQCSFDLQTRTWSGGTEVEMGAELWSPPNSVGVCGIGNTLAIGLGGTAIGTTNPPIAYFATVSNFFT